MTKIEINSLFDNWNNALKTNNPEIVTSLYAKNAILLPTMSKQIRHTSEEIRDYFINFLEKGPVGLINESNIRIFDKIAINSGFYTFQFRDGSSLKARFTFVYYLNDGQWSIIEHHSSQLP